MTADAEVEPVTDEAAPVGDTDDDAPNGDDGPDEDTPLDEVVDARVERSWSWHLTRVSGLFLALLIPVHFAVVTIANDVGRTTAASQAERFRNVTWRGIEWIVLMLALGHAMVALRSAIAASTRRAAVKETLVVMVVIAAALLAIGSSLVVLVHR